VARIHIESKKMCFTNLFHPVTNASTHIVISCYKSGKICRTTYDFKWRWLHLNLNFISYCCQNRVLFFIYILKLLRSRTSVFICFPFQSINWHWELTACFRWGSDVNTRVNVNFFFYLIFAFSHWRRCKVKAYGITKSYFFQCFFHSFLRI
jgi:hypothetical protein